MTTMQQAMPHMTESDDSTPEASTDGAANNDAHYGKRRQHTKASPDGARKQARARRERTGVRGGERSVAERRDTGASVSAEAESNDAHDGK